MRMGRSAWRSRRECSNRKARTATPRRCAFVSAALLATAATKNALVHSGTFRVPLLECDRRIRAAQRRWTARPSPLVPSTCCCVSGVAATVMGGQGEGRSTQTRLGSPSGAQEAAVSSTLMGGTVRPAPLREPCWVQTPCSFGPARTCAAGRSAPQPHPGRQRGDAAAAWVVPGAAAPSGHHGAGIADWRG